MKNAYSLFVENLPEEFSIKHKVTESTEKKNFHLHKQLEIVFALSNNLKCKFETGVTKIPRNGMVLLNQMNLHYIFSEKNSGICDRYVIYFSPNYISHFSTPEFNLLACFLLGRNNYPVVLSIPEKQLDSFLSILQKMNKYYSQGDNCVYGMDLHLKFLLGEFLLLTNQVYFEQSGTKNSVFFQNHSKLVYDICEYIGRHYDTNLDMDSISSLFFISKTQLYYIFREILGMTVSEYITEYRITKAKNFLINSNYSIEIISQAVGYLNISSFSRAFKRETGYSPLQYRQKHSVRPK